MTYEEGSFAGGMFMNSNQKYYLFTGERYWTMTPVGWSGEEVAVGFVHSDGRLNGTHTITTYGVRPVLSLKSSVTITSGDGTELNPYVVN